MSGCGCDDHAHRLIPLSDAEATVVATARAVAAGATGTERVPLREAADRVLAEDVLADRDQPAFDRSAMDGYAVLSDDLSGDAATLSIIGEVAAGTAWGGPPLRSGQTLAIMTGAPVPAGADAVQMVERCRLADGAEGAPGDLVTIEGPVPAGQHIAPQGEDVRTGDVVIAAGTRLTGLRIGVLASVGCAEVPVVRRPRVAIIATGDELVEVDERPLPHQIRETNRHTLEAMVEATGAEPVEVGHARDDVAALDAAIDRGLEADVLVLSGGVSAGRYDLVADGLRARGVEVLFHKIAVKPGKPVLFGRRGETLVFGLPGNPVSAFVTAHLLLVPALRTLLGERHVVPWRWSAPLTAPLRRTGNRPTFYTATLDPEGVRPVACNGSGDQAGFAQGNCLIRRPPEAAAAAAGEVVEVVLLQRPV